MLAELLTCFAVGVKEPVGLNIVPLKLLVIFLRIEAQSSTSLLLTNAKVLNPLFNAEGASLTSKYLIDQHLM